MHKIFYVVEKSGNDKIGDLLVAATDEGVCCLIMDRHAPSGTGNHSADQSRKILIDYFKKLFDLVSCKIEEGSNSVLDSALPYIKARLNKKTALTEEQEGNEPKIVFITGTTFQKKVWNELIWIFFGETISYSELAYRIGSPRAFRAVALACGANPISILVPCHRVIAKNGDIGGYHWGIEAKKCILELEKAEN